MTTFYKQIDLGSIFLCTELNNDFMSKKEFNLAVYSDCSQRTAYLHRTDISLNDITTVVQSMSTVKYYYYFRSPNFYLFLW